MSVAFQKIFRGECYELLAAQLQVFFGSVWVSKPDSSRARSAEAFVVCKNFAPPHNYTPVLMALFGAPPPTSDAPSAPSSSSKDSKQAAASTSSSSSSSSASTAPPKAAQVVNVNDLVVPFLACGDLAPHDSMAAPYAPPPASAIAAEAASKPSDSKSASAPVTAPASAAGSYSRFLKLD
jgi:tRNA (cytidine32/guanosine34-2'-O)-methyltransferase